MLIRSLNYLFVVFFFVTNSAQAFQKAGFADGAAILPQQQSRGPDVLSVDDRLQIFERVWKRVRDDYVDPKLNGLDWKRAYEQYQPMIRNSKSDEEFYDLIRRMLAPLHDTHTFLQRPPSSRRYAGNIGIYRARLLEGRIVATSVFPNSEAERAGIRRGTILRAINGKPIEQALEELRAVINCSTERSIWVHANGELFRNYPGTATRITFENVEGGEQSADLTFRATLLMAGPNSPLIWRRLSSGLGYIRFTSIQDDPIVGLFNDALDALMDTPGLIIDLRGNSGGSTPAGEKIVSRFIDRLIPIFAAGSREREEGPFDFVSVQPGSGRVYSKPLVILVDEVTVSAAEFLVGGFKDIGRAKVVGDTATAGATHAPTVDTLPGGARLAVSNHHVYGPKGNSYEGIGVIPDVLVTTTIEDIRQGKDPVLEAAEKLLLSGPR